MTSRSIICRSRRLWQIIDLRDTDKSRYFAITEFNNCFIIPSLSSLFSGSSKRCLFKGLHFYTRAWFSITHEQKYFQNVICSKTHSWTVLRRSRPLFVDSYWQVTWFALGQWKGRKMRCLLLLLRIRSAHLQILGFPMGSPTDTGIACVAVVSVSL